MTWSALRTLAMSSNVDPGSSRRYRSLVELGRGGMAEVFLAVVEGQAGFNKLLVLKKTRLEFSQDSEFVTMFLDEARLAARLNHPNVVQTHEVGQDGEQYFIAMEYLEGQPLSRARMARSSSPMPLELQLLVLCDVLQGLHHAHELCDFDGTPLHVVHRDVSPHNVFVTYDGQVKVVDFGIAKAARATVQTQTGMVKGKVQYMPPEQAMGRQVDARTDVFAVGVMLFEAVAGKRFWADVPDQMIMLRLIEGEIPRLGAVAPEAPPALVEIAHRATAADPAVRYASAIDMATAIEEFMATLPRKVTHRELGKFMVEHFAEQRARVRRVIEAELSDLRWSGPTTSKPVPLFDAGGGLESLRTGVPTPGSPAASPTTAMLAAGVPPGFTAPIVASGEAKAADTASPPAASLAAPVVVYRTAPTLQSLDSFAPPPPNPITPGAAPKADSGRASMALGMGIGVVLLAIVGVVVVALRVSAGSAESTGGGGASVELAGAASATASPSSLQPSAPLGSPSATAQPPAVASSGALVGASGGAAPTAAASQPSTTTAAAPTGGAPRPTSGGKGSPTAPATGAKPLGTAVDDRSMFGGRK